MPSRGKQAGGGGIDKGRRRQQVPWTELMTRVRLSNLWSHWRKSEPWLRHLAGIGITDCTEQWVTQQEDFPLYLSKKGTTPVLWLPERCKCRGFLWFTSANDGKKSLRHPRFSRGNKGKIKIKLTFALNCSCFQGNQRSDTNWVRKGSGLLFSLAS